MGSYVYRNKSNSTGKTIKQRNKTLCDDQDLTEVHFSFKFSIKHSRTPLIRINWDGEPSGYAEIRIIRVFFYNRVHWQLEDWPLLFALCACV
jgi:hypothetical protein